MEAGGPACSCCEAIGVAGEDEEVKLAARDEDEEEDEGVEAGERRDEESERIVCDAMDLREEPSASL